MQIASRTKLTQWVAVAAAFSVLLCGAPNALGQDDASCQAVAAACNAGCAVQEGLSKVFGKPKVECKARCESELKSCLQAKLPNLGGSGQGAQSPAPSIPVPPAQGRPEQRSPSAPLPGNPAQGAAVPGQPLGVGMLSVAPLVAPQANVRGLLAPSLDGVPAILAAQDSRAVNRFAVAYRQQVLGLQNAALNPDGLQNFAEGSAVDSYLRVRRALNRGIVGPDSRALPESDLVKALDPAFNAQYLGCMDPVNGSQRPGPNCFGANAKLWNNDSEFDGQRNKDAFAAAAKKALLSAYGHKTLRFVLIEQRALGAYDAAVGGFPFVPHTFASQLVPRPSESADAGHQVQLLSSGLRFANPLPSEVKMSPGKAEAWVTSLQEQNRREGLKHRTVFTLVRITCALGQPGALPSYIPCSLDRFEVFSDGEYSMRAPS